MPRIGVSYETVANAATELTVQGQHPTTDKVRELTQTGQQWNYCKAPAYLESRTNTAIKQL